MINGQKPISVTNNNVVDYIVIHMFAELSILKYLRYKN